MSNAVSSPGGWQSMGEGARGPAYLGVSDDSTIHLDAICWRQPLAVIHPLDEHATGDDAARSHHRPSPRTCAALVEAWQGLS